MPDSDNRVQGTILLVQEHRFRLLCPGGEQLLCELGPDVAAGPADLARLSDDATVVELRITAAPGTRAHRVIALARLVPPAAGSGAST